MPNDNRAQFPDKFRFLFDPSRYKVAFGGRGGAKSQSFGRALLIHGGGGTYFGRPLRILCTREIQKSIKDSVHALLATQIQKLGLESKYRVTETAIYGTNGSEFIFAGLKHNINNIKSIEDVDIVWAEEAHTVSKQAWEVLIPTIRKEGSEIWVSFNPELETDDTYKRFILAPPPGAKVVKANYKDNPWFPDVLRQEMEHLKSKDQAAYEHVYEGVCKQVVEGAIYREELSAAEKDGRLTRVPYDSTKPVDTFWDLGFGDNTSIWFAQSIGFDFRIIDFESNNLKDLSFYLQRLQRRGYVYGTHFLPHDAVSPMMAHGRTIQEQLAAVFPGRVDILPRLTVEDGIAAVRAIFSRCWFDATKCADGIQALRHYRYEFDENLLTNKRKPLHDWASHPADAFRYLAVAIQEHKRKRDPEPEPFYPGEQSLSWMG